MKRATVLLAFARVAACSGAAQPAKATGYLQGAAIGGVAGLWSTIRSCLFGGCAGGMVVHRMYSKWKAAHPSGTMQDFVADNKDKLPAGWADRLYSAGAINPTAGHQ